MANQNEPGSNEPSKSEPQANEPSGEGTPTPQANEPKPEDDELKDKHNEPAVNRGRYDRDMRAKDDRIAELERQLEESGKKAKSGEDALRKVAELEARLEDEKVSGALRAAGCVNEKAAKALLGDYDGDVAKLASECPYLFGGNARQTGSTGARGGGASDGDDWIDKAFGLKKK